MFARKSAVADKKKALTGRGASAIIHHVVKLKCLTEEARGKVAEDRVMQSLLLDFYGELLTDKQRSCCELHFNEDLSLAEIAEQIGVSRQGVWDNIRRGAAMLTEIEEKTGLIRRFSETQKGLERLDALTGRLLSLPLGEEAAALADEIRREIRELRG